MANKKEKNSPYGGILVVVLIILLSIGLFFVFAILPTFFATFMSEETAAIEGDGAAYDPIAAYDTVLAYAGENAQLISISAYYVRSDGTQDLYADYFPRVEYEFYLLVDDEDGNEIPLGAPNSTANAEQLYQAVTVSVWQPNQMRSVRSGSNSYSYMHLGMERDADEPTRNRPASSIPAPQCSFAELWRIAIEEENAPATAVAIIEYDEDGYHFRINDTDIRLDFDEDCQLD